MLASITRLRLRSFLYLLPFIISSRRIARQAEIMPGNRGIRLRKTRGLAFWTLTLWEDREAMEFFRGSGAHRRAMPKLKHWCDQAAVASWETQGEDFPDWNEAEQKLAQQGRPSLLFHPSYEHAQGRIVVD